MFTMMVFLWVKHTTKPKPLRCKTCLQNIHGNVMQGFCTGQVCALMIAMNIGKHTMKTV